LTDVDDGGQLKEEEVYPDLSIRIIFQVFWLKQINGIFGETAK
jgi:hypothetical protein